MRLRIFIVFAVALCAFFLVFPTNGNRRLDTFARKINFPIKENCIYDLDIGREGICGGRMLVDGWIVSQTENLLHLLESSSLKRCEVSIDKIEMGEYFVGIGPVRERFPNIDLRQVSFYYFRIENEIKMFAIASNKGDWIYIWGWY